MHAPIKIGPDKVKIYIEMAVLSLAFLGASSLIHAADTPSAKPVVAGASAVAMVSPQLIVPNLLKLKPITVTSNQTFISALEEIQKDEEKYIKLDRSIAIDPQVIAGTRFILDGGGNSLRSAKPTKEPALTVPTGAKNAYIFNLGIQGFAKGILMEKGSRTVLRDVSIVGASKGGLIMGESRVKPSIPGRPDRPSKDPIKPEKLWDRWFKWLRSSAVYERVFGPSSPTPPSQPRAVQFMAAMADSTDPAPNGECSSTAEEFDPETEVVEALIAGDVVVDRVSESAGILLTREDGSHLCVTAGARLVVRGNLDAGIVAYNNASLHIHPTAQVVVTGVAQAHLQPSAPAAGAAPENRQSVGISLGWEQPDEVYQHCDGDVLDGGKVLQTGAEGEEQVCDAGNPPHNCKQRVCIRSNSAFLAVSDQAQDLSDCEAGDDNCPSEPPNDSAIGMVCVANHSHHAMELFQGSSIRLMDATSRLALVDNGLGVAESDNTSAIAVSLSAYKPLSCSTELLQGVMFEGNKKRFSKLEGAPNLFGGAATDLLAKLTGTATNCGIEVPETGQATAEVEVPAPAASCRRVSICISDPAIAYVHNPDWNEDEEAVAKAAYLQSIFQCFSG